MFKKTKLYLVSLYTLFFFVILSIFSIAIYLYMNHTTYAPIDQKLKEVGTALIHSHEHVAPDEHERESDRKISYLLIGKNDKVLEIHPQNAFTKKDLLHHELRDEKKAVQTETIEGHSYRILTMKVQNYKFEGELVKFVQLIYNIDPEVLLLQHLLLMIGFGSVGGLILSILFGHYLANRTLVPIQRSWDKQSQFVADASHELRTPLSVIQTHLELLFRHPTNTIEQESETIYKSLSEVKRINKLVEDLLTLARTDSNEQLINPDSFSMEQLLRMIVEQFQPIAMMKEISLDNNIEANLLYYGDQQRLHQLFVILLDNALKYTPTQGKVSITAKKDGNQLKISIKDTGIGISGEDLPHIFDRFYRSDKGRTRSAGGTGLGLSIAKWIVKAHEGQISVESKLTAGTVFLIKLPIKETGK